MGFFDKLFGKKDMDDEINEYNKRADAAKQGSSPNVRYTMKKTTMTFGTGAPQNVRDNVVSSSKPQTQKTSVVLRQSMGEGYDMAQSLSLMDRLNSELQACVDAKNSGKAMPPRTDVVMPAEVKKGGFNKQDFETMVSEVSNMIERIRSGE